LVMGAPAAASAYRFALRALLVLNAIALALLVSDLRAALADARGPRVLAVLGVLALLGGILVPLWLLGAAARVPEAIALALILMGAVVVRREVTRLPHSLGKARPGG
ncbi:MAG TPA: hypothetical protein VFD73_22455, partial [Gemmatimonadales bacterium]|nr:hypothetical protein [Gemmatimonadales bacterium]